MSTNFYIYINSQLWNAGLRVAYADVSLTKKIPSFTKVNLFNEVSKFWQHLEHNKIKVWFKLECVDDIASVMGSLLKASAVGRAVGTECGSVVNDRNSLIFECIKHAITPDLLRRIELGNVDVWSNI